jgi:hypothetical protein
VLDHIADLESDFSAIHRISDMYSLDGPTFFSLAYRLSAYRGVMRARVENEADARADRDRPDADGGARVEATEAELRYSAAFDGLVEWGRG